MKIHLDAQACVGHGRCYSLAPGLFAPDDAGHCIVLQEIVPPGAEKAAEAAEAAASNCPEGAITLEM